MESRKIVGTPVESKELVIKNQSIVYLFFKRILDFIGAIIGLVIFSPIFIVISILYMWGDNKGPVFFKQVRMGKNGK
ncbi:hypothetical protein bcgnr5380_12360 [Bacillus cereus]